MAIKKIYFAEKSDVKPLATKVICLCSTMIDVKRTTDKIRLCGNSFITVDGAIQVTTGGVSIDSLSACGIRGPDWELKNYPLVRMTARYAGVERELSMSCGSCNAFLHLVNVDTMTNHRIAAHIPITAFKNLQGAIVCGGSCDCGCSCGCGLDRPKMLVFNGKIGLACGTGLLNCGGLYRTICSNCISLNALGDEIIIDVHYILDDCLAIYACYCGGLGGFIGGTCDLYINERGIFVIGIKIIGSMCTFALPVRLVYDCACGCGCVY